MCFLIYLKYIGINTMLTFPAEGSELFVLLGFLFIIYFIISVNISERKKIKMIVDNFLDEAESIESKYGKISKSYYWITPEKSEKCILILKKSKKIIINDFIYDYIKVLRINVKQEEIIKKRLFRSQLINQYYIEFLFRDGFDSSYPYKIKLSDKDKIYANPSFILSKRKNHLSPNFVMNEIESIVSEVIRRNRKH